MYPLVIPIPPEKLCVHVYLRVQRYLLNRCWGVQGVVEKVKFLKPYQPKKLTWQRKITIFMRRYTFHFLSCQFSCVPLVTDNALLVFAPRCPISAAQHRCSRDW